MLINLKNFKKVKKLLYVFKIKNINFSTTINTILPFKNNGLKSFIQFPQTYLNHNIFIYKK